MQQKRVNMTKTRLGVARTRIEHLFATILLLFVHTLSLVLCMDGYQSPILTVQPALANPPATPTTPTPSTVFVRVVTQANREAVLGGVGTVAAAPDGTPGEEAELERVIAASTIRKNEAVLERCFAACT